MNSDRLLSSRHRATQSRIVDTAALSQKRFHDLSVEANTPAEESPPARKLEIKPIHRIQNIALPQLRRVDNHDDTFTSCSPNRAIVLSRSGAAMVLKVVPAMAAMWVGASVSIN